MKQKVSDYIADYISQRGILHVFTVTGGGAMHMNDSFGHHKVLHCTYHHHEQAAAMAAEAYARYANIPAAVCVTSGPGAVNALTGVLCGWMESIPMLVFSGQVRYATTVRNSGLNIRSMGVQEYDVVRSAEPMTKYAVMVTKAEDIRYHLEKALYLAVNQRPGPVWLDIPLDVQSAVVEVDSLQGFQPEEEGYETPKAVDDQVIRQIIEKVQQAHRPVLFGGNGVHLAGAEELFWRLKDLLGIPVVTGMSSVDLMETEDSLYVGRNGGTGNRPGNFAVQNSDVLLSIGSRQSILQTGFQYENWARAAYTIINDIDEEELKKPNIHVSLPVCAHAGILMEQLIEKLEEMGCSKQHPLSDRENWRSQCQKWKENYPVVTPDLYEEKEENTTNIYVFYKELTQRLPENANIVVSCGTSRVAGSQTSIIKKGQRFITNSATASMGYGLPAAIGTSVAAKGDTVYCVTGEGSLQMNIQELQTIKQNGMDVKLFVINNQGYHSIRQTQQSFFGEPLIGIGEESGDLSFPNLSKLAPAYGFLYHQCTSSQTIGADLEKILSEKGACICEVFVGKYQKTQPKISSRRLEDGRMYSAPLEDMYPFLSRDELKENMYIPLVEES
ncbi:MAG: thiamine pyrophosphate-binding protein [Lachnospiraceae bacterium]|nr:thiamine pyrophosphate-binding protein [Lachnospiraceae bacterium]MDD3616193.1 thiamine pyrophosphate-binding protein [Lachnospiraceae bacterium]